MKPLQYHDGQREVQREANSIRAADRLSTWVGPVTDYAHGADLVVLASGSAGDEGELHVAALSGPPPLVTASESGDAISVVAPTELRRRLPGRTWGGIVINPATARRSRIAGTPIERTDALELTCPVAFTNCRKYILATRSTGHETHIGPSSVSVCAFDDPWVVATIAHGETAFLITISPAGVADASHRGGQPGYLRYDATRQRLAWTEYLGDGMFVSVGNLRASPKFAMIVLDLETGDAVKLSGTAQYTNVRTDRHERVDALLQASEPFPVQGTLDASVERIERLTGFCWPRQRTGERERITSADSTSVQHPQ